MALYIWCTYRISGIPDYLVLPSFNAFMHAYLITIWDGFMHMVDIWDIWEGFIHMVDIWDIWDS